MTRNEALEYRRKIENAATLQTDEAALETIWMYPEWKPDTEYAEGVRLRRNGQLWKVRQAHTSQAIYPPSIDTASLYVAVAPDDAGTRDNPIEYNNNMELVAGLYYIQNGVVYLCNRSTGVPVYNNLADLIGLYVTTV